MPAQIMDGKIVAGSVRESLLPRIARLKENGITPGLAAVLVGDNPASATYVSSKAKSCQQLGMHSEVITKPAATSQRELVDTVSSLNQESAIHGILVQSPLPSHIDEMAITLCIAPEKDVDGFHPYNVGMMLLGHPRFLSCTPYGIIKLLEHYSVDPAGKEVVVIGRSNIVGKPIAAMLQQKGPMANATVTVAHSHTRNLAEVIRRADIVIAAIGRPRTVTADMIKAGAVIIDVGINRIADSSSPKGYRLVGDVDFDSCFQKASYITPVPGGVGLMTVAMLMANTVLAAELQSKTRKPVS